MARHNNNNNGNVSEPRKATVKRLVLDRGFGFLRDEGGQEYFFHRSTCHTPFESLHEGQAVTFDIGDSPKGPRAESVRAV